MDEKSSEYLTVLRDRYFPEKRNYLKAHLTLFHKLSEEQGPRVLNDHGLSKTRIEFKRPYSLGLGVAIEAESPELLSFKIKKIKEFHDALTPQDQNKGRLHITIQNKVSVPRAKATLKEVEGLWKPFSGRITGLQLWEYLGGPWQLFREENFGN